MEGCRAGAEIVPTRGLSMPGFVCLLFCTLLLRRHEHERAACSVILVAAKLLVDVHDHELATNLRKK